MFPPCLTEMGRDADGEITNHIVMSRTKVEKKTTSGRSDFTEKENFGWLSFQICRKNHNKESLEGKFQNENKAGTDTANQ